MAILAVAGLALLQAATAEPVAGSRDTNAWFYDLPSVPGAPVWHLGYSVLGLHPSSLDIFVGEPANGIVETRWAFPEAGVVEASSFEAATRRLLGSEAYAFHWVLREDVAQGYATFGHDRAVFAGIGDSMVVFQSESTTYTFSRGGGILVSAANRETGTRIVLKGIAAEPAFPPALPGETTSGPDPMGGPSPDVGGAPLSPSGAGEEQLAGCQAVVRNVLGGSASCQSPAIAIARSVVVTGYDIGVPPLGAGEITGTMENADAEAYYVSGCLAERPHARFAGTSLTRCGAAPVLGVDRDPGPHAVRGEARFDACLHPVNLFTCPWYVTFTFEDRAQT